LLDTHRPWPYDFAGIKEARQLHTPFYVQAH
jgi:hypothetical protein